MLIAAHALGMLRTLGVPDGMIADAMGGDTVSMGLLDARAGTHCEAAEDAGRRHLHLCFPEIDGAQWFGDTLVVDRILPETIMTSIIGLPLGDVVHGAGADTAPILEAETCGDRLHVTIGLDLEGRDVLAIGPVMRRIRTARRLTRCASAYLRDGADMAMRHNGVTLCWIAIAVALTPVIPLIPIVRTIPHPPPWASVPALAALALTAIAVPRRGWRDRVRLAVDPKSGKRF